MIPRWFYDLAMRASALGGKFLLMLFIAKYLTVSDVGFYGLCASTISICLYFVGLDFYVYSTREILKTEGKHSLSFMMVNQFFFFITTYILLFISWPYILSLSGIHELIIILFFIVIAEHLSQEIYRALIALEDFTKANFVLFIRTGLWCYLSLPFLFYNTININDIFIFWLVSSWTSVLIGIFFIYRRDDFVFTDIKFSVKWIYNGVKISFLFFIGTICLRAINYFDKVIAVHFIDKPNLGVYVFFVGISSAIQALIDVLVVTRNYPALVRVVQGKNYDLVSKEFKRFQKNIFIGTIGFYLLSIPLCYMVALLTGKAEYLNYFYWYICIVLVNIILNISMPYHYYLYARKKDKNIVMINTASLIIFLLMSFLVINVLNVSGMIPIILAMFVSNVFVLAAKVYLYRREHYK